MATQIVASVANTYYNLAALDEQKKVLEETIRNREEGVETNKSLKTAGIVSEVAVKQNEAILVNARALLLDTENAIQLNENILSVLLWESPGVPDRRAFDAQSLAIDVKTGFPALLHVRFGNAHVLKGRTDIQVILQRFFDIGAQGFIAEESTPRYGGQAEAVGARYFRFEVGGYRHFGPFIVFGYKTGLQQKSG